MILGHLGPSGPCLFEMELRFKAKKVTLYALCRRCAKRALLGRKVRFLVNFQFFREKGGLEAKMCTFPDLGPQNTQFSITFIKGFGPGPEKSVLGAKEHLLGARMPKIVKFRTFCNMAVLL